MSREHRCYLLSLHVVFTEVFNNINNRVTYIAAKSLHTRLRGASIQNSWSILGPENKSSCHQI